MSEIEFLNMKYVWFNMDIHTCCETGNLERLRQLIAEKVDLNKQDARGNTPLRWASAYGQIEIVKELLKHNANANIGNYRGWTPFHYACYYGYLNIVKILIEYIDLPAILDPSVEFKDNIFNISKTQAIKDFIKNYQELETVKPALDD